MLSLGRRERRRGRCFVSAISLAEASVGKHSRWSHERKPQWLSGRSPCLRCFVRQLNRTLSGIWVSKPRINLDGFCTIVGCLFFCRGGWCWRLWTLEPLLLYASAGMESDPGALPLQSWKIASCVWASVDWSSRTSLHYFLGRRSMASSFIDDGQ